MSNLTNDQITRDFDGDKIMTLLMSKTGDKVMRDYVKTG